MNEMMTYSEPAQCGTAELQSTSIRQGLETKKARLEKQLADTSAALEAMDSNPEVARVMELVMKANRY